MKNLVLHVKPYKQTENSTLSRLYIDNVFICFVLEDGFNEPKVYGETRIPGNTYEVTRRKVGKFYERYKKRFRHLSSLWIREVPNFKYILIHIGNNILDSHGCLLVGSRYKLDVDEYRIYNSTKTYRKLYTKISNQFKKGGKVFIQIDRKALK